MPSRPWRQASQPPTCPSSCSYAPRAAARSCDLPSRPNPRGRRKAARSRSGNRRRHCRASAPARFSARRSARAAISKMLSSDELDYVQIDQPLVEKAVEAFDKAKRAQGGYRRVLHRRLDCNGVERGTGRRRAFRRQLRDLRQKTNASCSSSILNYSTITASSALQSRRRWRWGRLIARRRTSLSR
jgi:hypothetical protein